MAQLVINNCKEEERHMSKNDELRNRVTEDLLVNHKLMLTGVLTSDVIELIVMQIFKINKIHDEQYAGNPSFNRFNEPIEIYINSPGGLVSESLSIVSAIESSRTPVHTICLGHAASAAALVLLSGHFRMAQKYSRFMIHEISGGKDGPIAELSEYVEETKKLQQSYDNIITSRTKITKEVLKEKYKLKQDFWMNAKDMLKMSVIDKII